MVWFRLSTIQMIVRLRGRRRWEVGLWELRIGILYPQGILKQHVNYVEVLSIHSSAYRRNSSTSINEENQICRFRQRSALHNLQRFQFCTISQCRRYCPIEIIVMKSSAFQQIVLAQYSGTDNQQKREEEEKEAYRNCNWSSFPISGDIDPLSL